jgi:hypothetical protein
MGTMSERGRTADDSNSSTEFKLERSQSSLAQTCRTYPSYLFDSTELNQCGEKERLTTAAAAAAAAAAHTAHLSLY